MEICVLEEVRATCVDELEMESDVYGKQVMGNVFFLGMPLCAFSVVSQVNGSAVS